MSADTRFANTPPQSHPRIRGRCPSCLSESLFLGSNGYVTCSVLGCKDPGAAHVLLDAPAPSGEAAAPLREEIARLTAERDAARA